MAAPFAKPKKTDDRGANERSDVSGGCMDGGMGGSSWQSWFKTFPSVIPTYAGMTGWATMQSATIAIVPMETLHEDCRCQSIPYPYQSARR